MNIYEIKGDLPWGGAWFVVAGASREDAMNVIKTDSNTKEVCGRCLSFEMRLIPFAIYEGSESSVLSHDYWEE